MRPLANLVTLASLGLLTLHASSCASPRCPARGAPSPLAPHSAAEPFFLAPAARPAPISADKLQRLQAAATAVCTASPEALARHFGDIFRRNRGLDRTVKAVLKLRSELGPCREARIRPPEGVIYHHRDSRQVGRLFLDQTGKISGLWFEYTLPTSDSLQAVAADLRKLPGRVGLTVRPAGGAPLLAVEADTPLAVASAFKLYVFKALLAKVRAGTLRWDEVLRLRADRSVIGTFLAGMLSAGHPMTLGTLATLMMLMSDNTATDHLLHRLGRETVEQVAGPRNTPLISTLEMFKLQDARNRPLAEAYLKASVPERRRLLGVLASRPASDFERDDKPPSLAALEWFYSTNELCNVMLEVKDHPLTRLQPGPARGFPEFDQVAFKRGFEPGVVNFTFALRHATTQRWTCVSATYNAAAGAQQGADPRLRILTQRLFHVLAEQLDAIPRTAASR